MPREWEEEGGCLSPWSFQSQAGVAGLTPFRRCGTGPRVTAGGVVHTHTWDSGSSSSRKHQFLQEVSEDDVVFRHSRRVTRTSPSRSLMSSPLERSRLRATSITPASVNDALLAGPGTGLPGSSCTRTPGELRPDLWRVHGPLYPCPQVSLCLFPPWTPLSAAANAALRKGSR